MGRKAVVAWAMAIMLSWSVVGRADSLATLGASSRGTAMGGALIGIAEGWEAAYYNSSALALSRNSSSVQISSLNGSLKINDDNSLGGGFTLKYGINRRVLRDRIGLGLIVGTSTTSSTGLSLDLGSLFGGGGAPNWNWQMYNDSLPLVLSVGAGFRITDWLSLGITAYQKPSLVSMGFYPLVVDPLLEMLLGINTGVIPSNVQGMGFSAGGDPNEDFVTGFNISFRPIKYLSLGYSYSPETWSRYKLRLQLVGGQGSILPEDQYIMIDMKVPGHVETTVYGGAANVPIPWNEGMLTLAYAHEIQNWDGFYPSSVQYQWDASQIFSPEWFSDKQPRDPGLKDVNLDRFGFEYTGSATPMLFWKLKSLSNARFAVRGGYYHWNSPQPDARYSWQVAMIDSDADVYSFGLGFGYDRVKKSKPGGVATPRVEIDLHFQQTNLEDRTYRMREDEWGNQELTNYLVQTSGDITQYGIQVTWRQ